MFKAFDEIEIVPIQFPDKRTISVSTASPSATNIHFFTGIRSLGKIKLFDVSTPSSFGLTKTRELKYQFLFDKTTVPGSSTTAERSAGIFLSNPDMYYKSSSNSASLAGHQALFNYTQGYLYRNDLGFTGGVTSLRSASTAADISVVRVITIRRDMFNSTIDQNSVRIEMNLSNTSSTGIATGASTGLTTALDLKNPYGGKIGMSENSFFGSPWGSLTSGASGSIDTCTTALTIEAIIRPYDPNSVVLWKRLASSAWAGSTRETQDAFIKLELTKSSNNAQNAFRLYIRSVSANGEFTESFAQNDVQASGLFVPGDVGVNLFDGKFHHIVTTWGTEGIDGSTTVESGAGAVFGYIDGFKLLNREETDPRLGGADSAGGPTVQSNMFEQRFPIRRSPITHNDPEDGATAAGNNLYIGVSNFNRALNDTVGDKPDGLAASGDDKLQGGYDGQIEHVRMWNVRFDDGTTGVKDSHSQKVTESSTAGISFNNFRDASLTAGENISANLVAWWNFNELNTLTADDGSTFSNTGEIVGRGSINLYDIKDIAITAESAETDSSISSVTRTFQYIDIPENKVINNEYSQGRIVRRSFDGSQHRVGIVYYELGVIVLDSDDANAKLNFLWPSSGTTGDFGFSVTAINNSALNIERCVFNSVDNRGRLMLNAHAGGNEFNYTENPTGVNPETGDHMLDDPAGYITTVGLYNNEGDLLAVSKLSVPVRKDETRELIVQTKMDF